MRLQCVGEVARAQQPERLVSKGRLRQNESIQMVREKRETETENHGFSTRPFVLRICQSSGRDWDVSSTNAATGISCCK
jgi:hypothetical protein